MTKYIDDDIQNVEVSYNDGTVVCDIYSVYGHVFTYEVKAQSSSGKQVSVMHAMLACYGHALDQMESYYAKRANMRVVK